MAQQKKTTTTTTTEPCTPRLDSRFHEAVAAVCVHHSKEKVQWACCVLVSYHNCNTTLILQF